VLVGGTRVGVGSCVGVLVGGTRVAVGSGVVGRSAWAATHALNVRASPTATIIKKPILCRFFVFIPIPPQTLRLVT
jgi:hypothetical protein